MSAPDSIAGANPWAVLSSAGPYLIAVSATSRTSAGGHPPQGHCAGHLGTQLGLRREDPGLHLGDERQHPRVVLGLQPGPEERNRQVVRQEPAAEGRRTCGGVARIEIVEGQTYHLAGIRELASQESQPPERLTDPGSLFRVSDERERLVEVLDGPGNPRRGLGMRKRDEQVGSLRGGRGFGQRAAQVGSRRVTRPGCDGGVPGGRQPLGDPRIARGDQCRQLCGDPLEWAGRLAVEEARRPGVQDLAITEAEIGVDPFRTMGWTNSRGSTPAMTLARVRRPAKWAAADGSRSTSEAASRSSALPPRTAMAAASLRASSGSWPIRTSTARITPFGVI